MDTRSPFPLILALSLLSLTTRGQDTLYYEANWLNARIGPAGNQLTVDTSVFIEVGNVFQGVSTVRQLQYSFLTNPFLKGFVKPDSALVDSFSRILRGRISFTGGNAASFTSSLEGVGTFNVTSIANGLADLMISRAKQELTIAFFNKFQEYAKTHVEFKTLFPTTYSNLLNLLSYNYTQMLQQLRNGFFSDLNQLPFNIEALLELPKYKDFIQRFPEVSIAVQTLEKLQSLENGKENMADLLSDVAGFKQWDSAGPQQYAFKNAGAVIKLAAVLSNSLRSENKDSIWISGKNIAVMLGQKPLTMLYLGLLDQALKQHGVAYYSGANKISVADLLERQKDNILMLQNKIAQFVSLGEKVNDAVTTLNQLKTKKQKPSNADIYNYISVSVDAANFAFSFIQMLDPYFNGMDYLTMISQANNLYKDVYTQQYTQAISDGLDILTSINTLAKDSASDKKVVSQFLDFIQKVKPYALFIANMAEAKDETGVEAALENSILPVGSSSVKKNTQCNLAIQSYLGAFYQPWPPNNLNDPNAWTDKFGVIAPIGIAWTPACGSWRSGGSLSLFGSVFDVGAIVDYKLQVNTPATGSGQATTVSKNYSVQLGQIFSPGLYLVYGFFDNLPLALGIGGQYGPGLSKINGGTAVVSNNPSWRWNAFLAVDLPLFNLVNKNRH